MNDQYFWVWVLDNGMPFSVMKQDSEPPPVGWNIKGKWIKCWYKS